MALTVTIDAARRLLVTRASGTLTMEDVTCARAQARGNPEFDPTFFELFDIRDVTEVQLTGAELARIAASSVLAHGVCRAFVVSNQKQHGLARLFSGLAEPHEQRVLVFRDIEVAESWLVARRAAGTQG